MGKHIFTDKQWFNFICGFQAGLKLRKFGELPVESTTTMAPVSASAEKIIGFALADSNKYKIGDTVNIPVSVHDTNIEYSAFSNFITFDSKLLKIVSLSSAEYGNVAPMDDMYEGDVIGYTVEDNVLHVVGRNGKIYNKDQILYYINFKIIKEIPQGGTRVTFDNSNWTNMEFTTLLKLDLTGYFYITPLNNIDCTIGAFGSPEKASDAVKTITGSGSINTKPQTSTSLSGSVPNKDNDTYTVKNQNFPNSVWLSESYQNELYDEDGNIIEYFSDVNISIYTSSFNIENDLDKYNRFTFYIKGPQPGFEIEDIFGGLNDRTPIPPTSSEDADRAFKLDIKKIEYNNEAYYKISGESYIPSSYKDGLNNVGIIRYKIDSSIVGYNYLQEIKAVDLFKLAFDAGKLLDKDGNAYNVPDISELYNKTCYIKDDNNNLIEIQKPYTGTYNYEDGSQKYNYKLSYTDGCIMKYPASSDDAKNTEYSYVFNGVNYNEQYNPSVAGGNENRPSELLIIDQEIYSSGGYITISPGPGLPSIRIWTHPGINKINIKIPIVSIDGQNTVVINPSIKASGYVLVPAGFNFFLYKKKKQIKQLNNSKTVLDSFMIFDFVETHKENSGVIIDSDTILDNINIIDSVDNKNIPINISKNLQKEAFDVYDISDYDLKIPVKPVNVDDILDSTDVIDSVDNKNISVNISKNSKSEALDVNDVSDYYLKIPVKPVNLDGFNDSVKVSDTLETKKQTVNLSHHTSGDTVELADFVDLT